MYKVGNRQKNHHKRIVLWAITVVLVLAVLIGGGIYAKRFLHARTTFSPSTAVVTPVTAATPATRTYDAGIFTIQLPISWAQVAGESNPYDVFRWEGDNGEPDEELLEVYQDTIPQNLAVNRVLAISGNGNQVTQIGAVSDNCANFTKIASGTDYAQGVPAKWAGVNFLCDLANSERDVVGTSSSDGVNTVVLDGPTTGSHAFFFSFTDNSIDPDYDDFYNALASFRLK